MNLLTNFYNSISSLYKYIFRQIYMSKFQLIHLWFGQNLSYLPVVWNLTLYRPEISSIRGPFGLSLLLLKTENWKHCSKIIFKCVNSIMGPIFNIFLIREQCMHSVWTVHTLFTTVKSVPQSQKMRAKKKKKQQKTWRENVDAEPKRLRYLKIFTHYRTFNHLSFN